MRAERMFGAVRREGLTRDMKSEAAERSFALGFALEQLREHLFTAVCSQNGRRGEFV
jgi:hypothetical protein